MKVKPFFSALLYIFIKIVGFLPSQTLRIFFYRLLGMKIGKGSIIHSGAEIRGINKISIGENTIIGHGAILDGRYGLKIGNNVNMSTGVWIWTAQHDYNSKDFIGCGGSVIVEDYCWLSCRVVILPNVKVGKGAVVAAGAVVSKNVEEFAVVAGIPAKKIAERNKEIDYVLTSGDNIPFI